MKFTKSKTDQVLIDIELALRAVEEKHNIKVSRGAARYGDDISFKITVNQLDATEYGDFPSTQESRDFIRLCRDFRLMPDILFQEFNTPEGNVRIMGYSTRKRKYPIIYNRDGRSFKCSINYITNLVKNNVQEYMI